MDKGGVNLTYKYQGQEKVEITTGDFKGHYGYIRQVSQFGWLTIVIDGIGPKVTLRENEVLFVKSNFFSSCQ